MVVKRKQEYCNHCKEPITKTDLSHRYCGSCFNDDNAIQQQYLRLNIKSQPQAVNLNSNKGKSWELGGLLSLPAPALLSSWIVRVWSCVNIVKESHSSDSKVVMAVQKNRAIKWKRWIQEFRPVISNLPEKSAYNYSPALNRYPLNGMLKRMTMHPPAYHHSAIYPLASILSDTPGDIYGI